MSWLFYISYSFYYNFSFLCYKYIGYEVTAYVRDKTKLGSLSPHHIVEGDVLDKENVSKAIKDHDAVVIVLGTRNDLSRYFYMFI